MQGNSQSQVPLKEKSCVLHVYESNLVSGLKLVGLLHKAMTVALVIFYYSVIQRIPLDQMLTQNIRPLMFMICWVHLSSCFNLDFALVYWRKLGSESKFEYFFRIAKVVFKYTNLIIYVLLCLLWPLLSWLDF